MQATELSLSLQAAHGCTTATALASTHLCAIQAHAPCSLQLPHQPGMALPGTGDNVMSRHHAGSAIRGCQGIAIASMQPE